jgi:hypothetical protein
MAGAKKNPGYTLGADLIAFLSLVGHRSFRRTAFPDREADGTEMWEM